MDDVFIIPVSLLLFIIGTEIRMPWREIEKALSFRKEDREKEWSVQEKKEYRKEAYKGLIITWLVFNVAIFIYIHFFWHPYFDN